MWETRVARLFNILGHLSPHSQITVEDLAQEYEVNQKTIHRDINTLQQAKLGVFYEDGHLRISRQGYRRIRSWIVS